MSQSEPIIAIFLAVFFLQWNPQTSKRLEELEKQFNISVITKGLASPTRTSAGAITFQDATAHDLDAYTPILASEFRLYPRTLIEKSKLERIVLCEQLAFSGQFRNAVPDFEHNTLYLEVKRGNYNKQYLRKVIHHDFYHMIDYQDDGQVYADSEWVKLNVPDFKYGTGGQNAQADANSGALTDKFPGFLNQYSMTGVEEDKAEVYANLMVQSDFVEKRQPVDAILRSKVERIKYLMVRFCDDADERFWKAARNTKRLESSTSE